MCMEDIRIQRRTRANLLFANVSIASGQTVRANPMRVALIVSGLTAASQDVRVRRTKDGSTANFFAGIISSFGSTGVSPDVIPIVGGRCVLKIEDYGQLILDELVVSAGAIGNNVNIFELELQEV